MFIPRKYEKYTNYNVYIIGHKDGSHEINHERLLSFIDKLTAKYKNPYVRFMWVANTGKAMCVVYSDSKKNERLTKLISFDNAEKETL
jgi:hypothetical protein